MSKINNEIECVWMLRIMLGVNSGICPLPSVI